MQYLFPLCLCCSGFAWRQDLPGPWNHSPQGTWGCPSSFEDQEPHVLIGDHHMGMRSPTVWGLTALAFPTHSPCGATVGCFLWQVLDFKPGSSSTTEQAALNNHLLFEGMSLSTGSCCRAPDVKQPVPGLLCDTTVYHRTCHGFFAPGFQPLRAFSVYQWKSELLPNLSFFSNDLYLPVCAGSTGDGRHGVNPWALPRKRRPSRDTGIAGSDQ